MTPSEQIDDYMATFKDWRGDLLVRIRQIIHEEAPNAVEEWKWRSPVFSDHGLLVSPGAFKTHVNINFFRGAHLPDPHGILTTTDAKDMRSIKLTQTETLNETAFRQMVRDAVAHNSAH